MEENQSLLDIVKQAKKESPETYCFLLTEEKIYSVDLFKILQKIENLELMLEKGTSCI